MSRNGYYRNYCNLQLFANDIKMPIVILKVNPDRKIIFILDDKRSEVFIYILLVMLATIPIERLGYLGWKSLRIKGISCHAPDECSVIS